MHLSEMQLCCDVHKVCDARIAAQKKLQQIAHKSHCVKALFSLDPHYYTICFCVFCSLCAVLLLCAQTHKHHSRVAPREINTFSLGTGAVGGKGVVV